MATGTKDYFKAMLLYGLYRGEPIPMACDEQGRLVLIVEEVSPFTKSGTEIWRDNFEDGLVKCSYASGGTGASVAIDTTEAVSGAQSCIMTGGSDGSAYARIGYYFPPSTYNKLALEFALRFGANIDHIDIFFTTNDAVNTYKARFRYDWADQTWYIENFDESKFESVLSSMLYLGLPNFFNRFKCVIDIPNGKYHKFVYPGGSADLTAYNLGTTSPTQFRYATVTISVYSVAGYNAVMLVDDVVITQDES